MSTPKTSMLDTWITRSAATPARPPSVSTPKATASPETRLVMEQLSSPLREDELTIMKTIPWTAINQPWRRDDSNAKLFDVPLPAGLQIKPHLPPAAPSKEMSRLSLEPEEPESPVIADSDDAASILEVGDEELGDDDLTVSQSECEEMLNGDSKLLRGKRLLEVATHYTNNEIAERTAEKPTTITQHLSHALTRVARESGVEREDLKKVLEEKRRRNGVLNRQSAYRDEMSKRGLEEKRKADQDVDEVDERPRKVQKLQDYERAVESTD